MQGKRVVRRFTDMAEMWKSRREQVDRLVFTNGCFDLLHVGHVTVLEEARALGSYLVVGLNSDASVRRLKGPLRPVNRFEDRAAVLAGLRCVDLVVGFDEDTPRALIACLGPDVLVKGGDWPVSEIVGSDWVLARGGSVRSLALVAGHSTTDLIDRIIRAYCEEGSSPDEKAPG